MSMKSQFTPDEWQLLLDVPPLVGTAVMVAGSSGLGTIKEAFTLANSVLRGKSEFVSNELIAALIDARLEDGDRSEVEQLTHNTYRQMKPDELLVAVLGKCREVRQLLSQKSTPQEAEQFCAWTLDIGERVAAAAKEGGFLGIGGERVSSEETRALTAVREALNEPPSA